MYPETRGRTSTDSTGSVRPVNSSHSTISLCSTGATVTDGAGRGAGRCELLRPKPVERTATALRAMTASVRRKKILRVIIMEFQVCNAVDQARRPLRLRARGLNPFAEWIAAGLPRRRRPQLFLLRALEKRDAETPSPTPRLPLRSTRVEAIALVLQASREIR